jgi:hypothetical protein
MAFFTSSGDEFARMDENYARSLQHKDNLNTRNQVRDIKRLGLQVDENPIQNPNGWEKTAKPSPRATGPDPRTAPGPDDLYAVPPAGVAPIPRPQVQIQPQPSPGKAGLQHVMNGVGSFFTALPRAAVGVAGGAIKGADMFFRSPGAEQDARLAAIDKSAAGIQQSIDGSGLGDAAYYTPPTPDASGNIDLRTAADKARFPDPANATATLTASSVPMNTSTLAGIAASPFTTGGVSLDALVDAVIQVESGGNPNAVNKQSGAFGLMQIIPKTAADPGYDVAPMRDKSPQENVRFGREYLNAMVREFGDITHGIMAYNAGPGTIHNWLGGKTLTAQETRRLADAEAYLKKVGAQLASPTDLYAAAPGGDVGQQVAQAQAPGSAGSPAADTVTIKNSAQTKRRGGVSEDKSDPVAAVATAKDISKIAPPKANLAFTFRSDQMNALMQQRKSMIQQARMYMLMAPNTAAGGNMIAQFRANISAHDVMIKSMAKKQAIGLLSNNRDPRMLNMMLSQQSGKQIEYGPNDDGTWYEKVDGVITVESMALSNITSVQLNAADKDHYDAMKDAARKAAASQYGKELDAILKMKVANNQGNIDAFLERIKAANLKQQGDTLTFKDEKGRSFVIVTEAGIGGKEVIKLMPVPASGSVTAYQRKP